MTRESTAPSVLYLHVLAFCAGMSIMAIELCAARLLAPYFGSSTFVWTNVIGVILIALAAVGSAAFREDLAGAPEPPLTDDRAPLELLMDWELLARRAGPG